MYTAIATWALLWASSSTLLFQLLLLDTFLGLIYYVVYSCLLLSIGYYHISSNPLTLPFLGLAGIPPLGMFWAKLLSLLRLPILHCLALLISSALVLFPYFNARVSFCSRGYISLTRSFFLLFFLPFTFCSTALAVHYVQAPFPPSLSLALANYNFYFPSCFYFWVPN